MADGFDHLRRAWRRAFTPAPGSTPRRGSWMKPVGEPDGGNPQVRFDERGRETGRCRMAQVTAPFLDSPPTPLVVLIRRPCAPFGARRAFPSGSPGIKVAKNGEDAR